MGMGDVGLPRSGDGASLPLISVTPPPRFEAFKDVLSSVLCIARPNLLTYALLCIQTRRAASE